jgi:glycosyltransferase involved in cell wall biosynthesis
MKILQVSPFFPPNLNGVSYYVSNLTNALSDLDIHVEVLTIDSENVNVIEEKNTLGQKIIRCPLDTRFYRAVISRDFYKRMVSSNSYDLYHLHMPFHLGLEAGVVASVINRIPLIITHHGEGFLGSPFYKVLSKTYAIFYKYVTLQGVDTIVFLTPSYRNVIRLAKNLNKRVRIVRTGSNVHDFSIDVDGEEIRQQYGITRRDKLILFVGNLSPGGQYKGVDVLIRAISIICKDLRNVKLLVVGGGELIKSYSELSASLGITENVIFAGPVDNSVVKYYYAASQIFALPSISGPENAPLVVFEAMASGKPVVATSLPGVVDIVVNNETGILVPPGDERALANTLYQLLMDDESLNRFGLNGRKVAEKYTWKNCAQEMKKIYMESYNKRR